VRHKPKLFITSWVFPHLDYPPNGLDANVCEGFVICVRPSIVAMPQQLVESQCSNTMTVVWAVTSAKLHRSQSVTGAFVVTDVPVKYIQICTNQYERSWNPMSHKGALSRTVSQESRPMPESALSLSAIAFTMPVRGISRQLDQKDILIRKIFFYSVL